jgi:hypothetical protein
MAPRPRRLWRRVARWLLYCLGGLVLLLAVAFGVLHTAWARDQIRGIAVSQLSKKLHGSIEIARLDGDLFDAITLRGIVVRDAQGKDVAKIDALTVDYSILPLRDQHFQADLIDIEGLEAELRLLPDGRLVVSDLWIQSPPSDSPPWSVTLADVKVRRSKVALETAPGKWDTFSDIDISAGLSVEPDALEVFLPSLTAEWKNQGIDLSLHGGLLVPKTGGLVATGVEAWAGRNHVMIPYATWGPVARSAAFVAEVSHEELARLWPESKLLTDVKVAGFANQDPASQKLSAHLFTTAGGGALSATAELGTDAASGAAALFWSGLEPAAVWSGLPEGRLHGWLTADVSGLPHSSPMTTAAMNGRVRGGVRGTLSGIALSSVKINANLAQRRLTGELGAGARFGAASVKLAALLPAELGDPLAIALERADVEARVRDVADLQEALGQPPTARGPIALTARASGRLDDLAVHASVKSDHLAQKQLRLGGLRAELGARHLDPRRLPGPAIGNAEVQVDSIVNGPTAYGKAGLVAALSDGGHRADVRFSAGGRSGIGARGALSARLAPGAAHVTFRELRIATRKLVWQGRGGRLDVADGGRQLSARLALSSAAGSVSVAAKLKKRGDDLAGPVSWKLGKIDLARVLAELGVKGVSGRIGSTGQITLPSGPGRIDVDASKVAWPGAPQPLDGRLRASLGGRKLDAHADIDAGPLGKVVADLKGRTPAVLTDGAAWKRLHAAAIQSLAVQADKVDLARLVRATSKEQKGSAGPPLRSGLAQLTIEAGPGLETGKLTLAIKGGQVAASPDVVVPITATLGAELKRAELSVTGKVDAPQYGAMDLDASVAVPGDPLDAAGWKRRGLDLVRSARVAVRGVRLERFQHAGGASVDDKPVRDKPRGGKPGGGKTVGKPGGAKPGGAKPGGARTGGAKPGGAKTGGDRPGGGKPLGLSGLVEAELTAGPGARALAAKVTFRDVRAADMAAAVSGQFTAQGQPRSTDLALAVGVKSGPLLDGTLSIAIGADDVRGLDFARLGAQLRTAALRGQLRIPDQPVVRLATAIDSAPAVSGRLSGQLTVGGTIAKPILSARIDAPGFTAQGVRFDRLQLRASYQAGPWRADVDARQSDGGSVLLQASGGRGERAPLQAHLTARQLRLGLLRPLWKRPGGMLTYLEGVLQADLNIAGSAEQPVVDGTVRVRDGEVRLAQYLRPINHAQVDVQFRRSQAQITVRAESRPGKVRIDSTINLRQLADTGFTARLTADDLPIDAGSQLLRLDGKVTASGSRRGPMWDMNVRIEKRFVVRLPSQKAEKLHATGDLDDVKFTDAAGLAQAEAQEEIKRSAGPEMRVHITSDGLVAVRSSDDAIRVDLTINLTSTKIGGATAIEGTVEGQRGWVVLQGQRYQVERAQVRFGGEIPPNPNLDVRLSHQFPEDTIYIDVTGSVSKLTLSFSSESGRYGQDELFAAFLSGNAPGDSGGSGVSKSGAESAAVGILANQVAGVARQAGLPVDVLRFSSDEESEGQGTGPNVVTVGKWLTDRLFVAFRYRSTTDGNKNQAEGQFQHFFTRDWMWEGVAGARENSIDLLWIVPLKR